MFDIVRKFNIGEETGKETDETNYLGWLVLLGLLIVLVVLIALIKFNSNSIENSQTQSDINNTNINEVYGDDK